MQPGYASWWGVETRAKATGLDFSGEVVELARKLVPSGRFQQGDAQALPFPTASFDAVLCGYGVMYLPEPEAALREILRVLRPHIDPIFPVWNT